MASDTYNDFIKVEDDQQEKQRKADIDALISDIESARDRAKPLSPERVAELRRRHKTNKIVAAITDAANAISNYVGTTQYAPNGYDESKTAMAPRLQERYDKLKAQRDAMDKEFLSYSLQRRQLLDNESDRRWKRALEKAQMQYAANKDARAERAQAAKDAAEVYKQTMYELNLQYRQGQITKQGLENKKLAYENEWIRQYGPLPVYLKEMYGNTYTETSYTDDWGEPRTRTTVTTHGAKPAQQSGSGKAKPGSLGKAY